MAESKILAKITPYTVPVSVMGASRNFYVHGDIVYVYMTLSGLSSTDQHNEIAVLPEELKPATSYMILTAYRDTLPYEPIGSVWASVNLHLHVYKPANVTSLYVFGSYLRSRT